MKVRVRLAPSPTGNFHIGTARTALFNWLFARKNNGSFLLRIEDTDKERSKSKYTENILNGLKWLDLNWDEEPIFQSQRIDLHQKAIESLLEKGLAYKCYASEEELELMREKQKSAGQPPRYDNRHRNLSEEQEAQFLKEGRTSVVRFRIEDEEIIQWNDMVKGPIKWAGKDLGGDMVISRRAPANKIGEPLYNLVVVVDDHDMRITHVIRGEDHISNTAKQILLYKAFNFQEPIFAHTPLILNPEGRKLSKRDGVTSISEFKEMGYTCEAMNNYMALLGWSPPENFDEQFTLEDASSVFSFDRVNKAGAKFDWDKLNWLNSQVIHSWPTEKLFNALTILWQKQGWEPINKEWGFLLTKLIGPSLSKLNDGIEESRVFFEDPSLKDDGIKQLKISGVEKCLNLISQKLDSKPWDGVDIEIAKQVINESAKSEGLKKGLIMKSLRAALLGSLKGPDLLTSWALLAKIEKDKARIKRSLEIINP